MGEVKGMSQDMMNIIKSVSEQIILETAGLVPTEPMQAKNIDIVEYNGRMRCIGIEKFAAPAYISVINFYLNAQDASSHKRAKGALVAYVEFENAGKLYKNLGISIPEDEDDASMMNACGEFCKMLANALVEELAKKGYADLFLSAPSNYKNSIMQGAEYSLDQTQKYELSFFCWKRKAIVVESSFASIPTKK